DRAQRSFLTQQNFAGALAASADPPEKANPPKKGVMMIDIESFTTRYVAMWNEPDPAARHQLVVQLWAEGSANFTQSLAVHGHEEIEARVTKAYETYVAPGTYLFKATKPAATHHDAIRVDWEMIDPRSGAAASTGSEFIILDGEGRIANDYQFLNP